ncbi:MAG: helix-turn-helix transcriptional regulator [Candidatus Delongbacteria bacterium]|nr:helix-turn-helix transcriptional regulator [Candidatus Delongbacteria bacterium]
MIFSNAELMLMQLIFENPNKTGYEINNWVQKLGYNKWAGTGKTSVYNGLNKLISKEFFTAQINSRKTGKGPLPTCYTITEKGKDILKQDMLETIRTARERDQRFDLVISAIHLLQAAEIIDVFSIRKKFLSKEYNRLSADYEEQKDCLPDGGKLLYERILMSLENEQEFTNLILRSYGGQEKNR